MTLIERVTGLFNTTKKAITNRFNEAFFRFVGSSYTEYDPNQVNYLEHGYNENSVVYSVLQQMATKTGSVPYFIKKIENEQKSQQHKLELKRWTGEDATQKMRLKKLEQKAYGSTSQQNSMPMPLEKPNPLQNWTEFFGLYKTYLRLTGNAYIYMLAPEGGQNQGEPLAMYLLPSHLIQITLKPDTAQLTTENPVKSYMLVRDSYYQDFPAENVVHIKLSNPNFDQSGEELYGQSPLRAVLRNVNSSNEATIQNLKLLKNSGVYGFIHGENQALTEQQAGELKSRLKEMDDNTGRLGRVAGVSSKIGFTRLSLTTEELRPFDFLSYDQKQICNALGWSDLLLNNDTGAKYDNVREFRKQVVTDNIVPDLMLLEDAFNNYILPRFKGYENTCIYFDVSYLPEMQLDMQYLVNWLTIALRDGVINRAEYREALNYEVDENNTELQTLTVGNSIMTLEDAIEPALPNTFETPNPGVDEEE